MNASSALYKEVNALLPSRRLDDWKVYLRWHLVLAKARYLSAPFEQADLSGRTTRQQEVGPLKARN